jgi:hypothetical protein
LISICANYFVGCETVTKNRKPVGVPIEGIGIAGLFIFHPVSLRFYGPKPVMVYPFGLPLFTWFSGQGTA